jgi:hypothetical protein
MFHPLMESPVNLKDQDLENKILDLSKKYHIAARLGQGGACQQIIMALEVYKSEQQRRHAQANKVIINQQEKGLDDLINVN